MERKGTCEGIDPKWNVYCEQHMRNVCAICVHLFPFLKLHDETISNYATRKYVPQCDICI